MLRYDFGPQHPLKPERLRRTIKLLEHFGVSPVDPGAGDVQDVLRVHDREFVRFIELISQDPQGGSSTERNHFGVSGGDTPAFRGMYEASLAYCAGSAYAARRVSEGAVLAFGIAGGLHHARRAQASGFCVFNDCAIALHILRERYQRVAYIDIDVHHGDGVQWIFYDDPTVLTASIHQDGRTLYPGTGARSETGAEGSAVNVPLPPGTGSEAWLAAFREQLLPRVIDFAPEAVVLQMGTDAHALDPLARLDIDAQTWLQAVSDVKGLNIPIVALGGGGYALTCVPRMWTAACLTLGGYDVPDVIPEPFASEWGTPRFFD